jgi:hypothetical protein
METACQMIAGFKLREVSDDTDERAQVTREPRKKLIPPPLNLHQNQASALTDVNYAAKSTPSPSPNENSAPSKVTLKLGKDNMQRLLPLLMKPTSTQDAATTSRAQQTPIVSPTKSLVLVTQNSTVNAQTPASSTMPTKEKESLDKMKATLLRIRQEQRAAFLKETPKSATNAPVPRTNAEILQLQQEISANEIVAQISSRYTAASSSEDTQETSEHAQSSSAIIQDPSEREQDKANNVTAVGKDKRTLGASHLLLEALSDRYELFDSPEMSTMNATPAHSPQDLRGQSRDGNGQ